MATKQASKEASTQVSTMGLVEETGQVTVEQGVSVGRAHLCLWGCTQLA